MSDSKREQLSVWMDGELDPRDSTRITGAVADDPQLRAAWDRYHLIGDVLRGEPVSREVRSIADRVRENLRHEPTVLAPLKEDHSRRWSRPLAASALAASAALAAFLISPGLFGPGEPQTMQLAERNPPKPALYLDATGTYWSLKRPEVESKLNRYLMEHQEYAPSSGMKGMLPYASFVSYDARR
jgi:sigma-E factor negative regulatory protein RseA